MYDNNLMLRKSSEAVLNASETARVGTDFGAGDTKELTYILKVPTLSGTSPTLAAKLQESADNTNWVDVGVWPFSDSSNVINAVGMYYLSVRCKLRYRRAHLTLGGTTPNYGLTTIGVEMGGDYSKF